MHAMTEEKEGEAHPAPGPPPRKAFRDHFLHTLPNYSGPFPVGYMEIEVPVREPRILKHHRHSLRLDTVLFSLYYPCELDADGRKRRRVPWLPRPRVPTCKGYAKFLNISHVPVTAYVACTSMFTKIPAYRNAKLASGWPQSTRESSLSGNSSPSLDGKMDTSEKPEFPVIILSHGLGGSRTVYSAVCGELASYGFIVVALEHRDGSGARTYCNVPEDSSQHRPDLYSGAQDNRGAVKLTKTGSRYYHVDYLFPKDNAQDTDPNNPRGVDTELRGTQINMRLAEIDEAFHVLTRINSGEAEAVVKANLRRKGNAGSSSLGLDGLDWSEWRGRLTLQQVTMMGHSFGGVTTVQVLRKSDRFPWVGQGVLLDAWGSATPESKHHIQKPLLSVGSETFMHWTENMERIQQICNEARDANQPCWMLTIRGSTHLSQSDFGLLYSHWMSWFMKTMINSRRAIYLTVSCTLEFLRLTGSLEQSAASAAWPNDRLLLRAADAESKMSTEHRPDQKWIATRLKIEHEFQWRLAGWLTRKKTRRASAPIDVLGQPLSGSETWIHMSPQPDTPEATRIG